MFSVENKREEREEGERRCERKPLERRRDLTRVFFDFSKVHKLLQEDDAVHLKEIIAFWIFSYFYVQSFDIDLDTFGFECFYVFLFQSLLGNKEIIRLFIELEFEEQGVVAKLVFFFTEFPIEVVCFGCILRNVENTVVDYVFIDNGGVFLKFYFRNLPVSGSFIDVLSEISGEIIVFISYTYFLYSREGYF